MDSLEANKGITNNNGSFFFWLVGEFERKPCCREWGGFELLIFLLQIVKCWNDSLPTSDLSVLLFLFLKSSSNMFIRLSLQGISRNTKLMLKSVHDFGKYFGKENSLLSS